MGGSHDLIQRLSRTGCRGVFLSNQVVDASELDTTGLLFESRLSTHLCWYTTYRTQPIDVLC